MKKDIPTDLVMSKVRIIILEMLRVQLPDILDYGIAGFG